MVWLGLAGLATTSSAGTAEPAKADNPVVLVEKSHSTELADEITYPAQVSSKVNAAINSDVDGIISKVFMPLGQHIRVDQPVFAIKNSDPVYQYVPVKVLSPIAGVISSIDVAEGSMVKRGQQLAMVTDPKQLRIMVEVAASDLTEVKAGLTGEFTYGSQNHSVPVKVVGVSPLVDPGTGTAVAELQPDSKSAQLPIGLVGRVAFRVNKRQGIQVPEQALVYRGAQTFLRVVENAKAKLVPVVVAATRRGLSEIVKGLQAGELVVIRASGFVADGQAVTVQQSDVATK